jgi:hypothetical protein
LGQDKLRRGSVLASLRNLRTRKPDPLIDYTEIDKFIFFRIAD